VRKAMLRADNTVFDGEYQSIIDVNFKWREIGSAKVGPKLPKKKDDPESHTHSNRTLVLEDEPLVSASYKQRYQRTHHI